jgi:glutamine amidotransferase-like uncharacterized protein
MKLTRNKKIILAFAVTFAIALPGFTAFANFANAQGDPTYIIPLEDWVLNDDVAAIRLVNVLLEENVTVKWAQESFTVGGLTYPAGTIFIETPFTTSQGITSDVMMQWFLWQAKQSRVNRIDITYETITANTTDLIPPRIVMFYDTSTNDNCINHYERFRSLGFKVTLATAASMTGIWWNDTAHPLHDANVFIMPGGSYHSGAFPYGDLRDWARANITEFVKNGGSWIGVCAGASEALMGTGFFSLLVNASDYVFPPEPLGVNEWRELIGPLMLSVEEPKHPVFFGYGQDAQRPGYGPEVPIYYYGGPAFDPVGTNATILARYSRPISQNMEAAGGQNEIWGLPAALAATFGNGRVVIFGPHPEWPGPGARLHAQAVFWAAQKRINTPSPLDPETTDYNPPLINRIRVDNIINTAAAIAPYLEAYTRTATQIVNLRSGNHYVSIGHWFDEVVMYYGLKFAEHINFVKQDAVKLDYEYYKLMLLRDSVSATTRDTIDYALALIDSFFNYSDSFPAEPHTIPSSDWTGNVFPTWIGDATDFTGLTDLFIFIENETRSLNYPMVYNYTRDYYNPWMELLKLNKTSPSAIVDNATLTRWGFDLATYAGFNVTDLFTAFFYNITASFPAGPMYTLYYMWYHVLWIDQFKIDQHLLNMMTIGDRARDVLAYLDYQIASEIGAWAYAAAEWQATLHQPAGAFV